MRQQQKAGDLDSGLDLQVGELTENEEDNEVYQEEMQRRAKRKATKSSKYSAAPTHAPMEEELVAGPRKVTKEVDQNRGLTPHRRKDLKNPRVKVIFILSAFSNAKGCTGQPIQLKSVSASRSAA